MIYQNFYENFAVFDKTIYFLKENGSGSRQFIKQFQKRLFCYTTYFIIRLSN